MPREIKLTESMEDYLEMLYRIVIAQGYVRPVNLSTAIQVKPSSVTRMIQKLAEAGFITYEKYRNLSLTKKGSTYGRFLVWRDEKLKDFFLLADENTSINEQVEGIEHYITPTTMRFIRILVHYFRSDPRHLQELEAVKGRDDYPDHEDLRLLRAWPF